MPFTSNDRRRALSRRRFLSGLGASSAAALPLWSLLSGRALAAGAPAPRRLVIWHTPEGTESAFFWPRRPGFLDINEASVLEGREAPDVNRHENWILQPLKSFESRLTLIRGIENQWRSPLRRHPEWHEAAVEGLLSGFGPNSVDEVVGRAIQGGTPFSALRLGNFGWRQNSPVFDRMLFMRDGQQVEANWSPAAVFDEVFPGGLPGAGGGAPETNADPVELRLRSRLALLGSVGTELRAIECAGGLDARLRLENYLDSMQRIETQIQSLIDEEPVATSVNLDVDLPAGARERSFWRNDDTFREVGQLMTDVAVASLALDRTRVVAMQWSATGFNDHDAYHFVVEETRNAGDHGLSHGHEGENPDALLPRDAARRDRARIQRWYNAQLASFLERLDAIPEGDGTLLDHTLVMTVTDSGGMDHQTYDLPFLTFNAPSSRGQYLEVERGRHHADYLLTIARAMGLSIDALGEGTRPIDALL